MSKFFRTFGEGAAVLAVATFVTAIIVWTVIHFIHKLW